jgi:hypothetical protein
MDSRVASWPHSSMASSLRSRGRLARGRAGVRVPPIDDEEGREERTGGEEGREGRDGMRREGQSNREREGSERGRGMEREGREGGAGSEALVSRTRHAREYTHTPSLRGPWPYVPASTCFPCVCLMDTRGSKAARRAARTRSRLGQNENGCTRTDERMK